VFEIFYFQCIFTALDYRLMSKLDPLADSSILGRKEELELRLRLSLWSFVGAGLSPDWRANKFKISVKEITPVKRPDMRAPGSAEAETADTGKAPANDGEAGCDPTGGTKVAWVVEGVVRGVAGADGEGDAASTTHIR